MKYLFLILFPLCGSAATWYVSATGNSTNGTYSNPWSVPYSVTNTNPHLQSGDTVLFKPGTFVCVETNGSLSSAQELEFRKSGTPSAKIRYRSIDLWGFHFDGGLLIPTGTSNIIVERFHLYDSDIASRVSTNYSDHPNGITEYGQSNQILHNLIENTGHPGIGSWKTSNGKYIAGNIIRFIGVDDWSVGYNGANRGSGMYLQNADNSSEALIQGNISYFNYTTGMKAYGNTDIWKFRFKNQICAENAEAGLFYHLDNYGSTNLTVDSNYLWRNGSGIRLGYPLGNSGHSNAVIAGNYVVETNGALPFYMVGGWSNTTWTNNLGVNLADRYVWQLELVDETGGDPASHHIDYNTYYSVTNVAPTHGGPFSVRGVKKTFPEWKEAILGDTNSTYTDGRPSALVSHVFAPSTDASFVHVAVFNWPTNASTTVDLSNYFPAGARLAIYDAQDIPNAYTNLTFSGSTVTLDLTRTNRATMLGTFTQRTDTWQGFDPRFRAFVVYRDSANYFASITVSNLIIGP